jgi:hypothetical protein
MEKTFFSPHSLSPVHRDYRVYQGSDGDTLGEIADGKKSSATGLFQELNMAVPLQRAY